MSPSFTLQNKNVSSILKEILLYFIMFFIVFGLSLFRLGMHYDEILDFYGQANDTYLAMNRSGLYLYRIVFGEGANSWSSPLVAGLFLSIATFLQTRLFKIKSVLAKFIFAGMMLSSYQFIYVLRYSIQCDAVVLTYVLTTLAAFLMLKSSLKPLYRILLATLFLTFSISIYQSTLLYFSAIVLIVFLQQLLENRKIPQFKQLLLLGLVVVLSVTIWYAVSKATNFRISEEAYAFLAEFREVQDARAGSMDISLSLHVISTLHFIKLAFLQGLYLEENYHGYFYVKTVSYLQLSALIPIFYLIFYFVKNYRFTHTIVASGLLICLWVSPYLLTLALRGVSGTHSWLAEPLILGILWSLAYQYRPRCLNKTKVAFCTQIFMISIVAFCLIKNIYRVSAHERQMGHYANLMMSALQDINAYGFYESEKQDKKLSIVLVHSHGDQKQISHGYNLAPFYKHFNYTYIRSAKKEEIPALQEDMTPLSIWPSHNSIMQKDSVLYIKVPHFYSGNQIKKVAF